MCDVFMCAWACNIRVGCGGREPYGHDVYDAH